MPQRLDRTPVDVGRSPHRPAATTTPGSVESRAWASHSSLGLLIDAVEEYAIFSLDPHGAVRTWNVGAHRIKGYTAQEILGRHFSVFYVPEDQQASIPDDELAHATAHGQWSGEGWRVRKDGTRFWANVVITAVFDADGRLDGFVKVTRDESDRKAAEDAHRLLALVLERERIATGLSDTTVRSIFSATIALDGALTMTKDPRLTERITDAMSILERSLRQVRDTVTGLAAERELSVPSPRVPDADTDDPH